MIKRSNSQGGLVKMIVIIVVILLVLAYLGLNLREITSSPTFQDNWNFLKDLILNLWNNYLKEPATAVWDFFIPNVWDPTVESIKNIQDGSKANMPTLIPTSTLNVVR